jgi:hypothetical protein
MYRACSTWQYEVVAHLVERHFDGRRLGYLTSAQYTELVRTDALNRASAPRRVWRVFKSHEGDRCFTRALVEGRALAVYAYRDVRDVAFSLMHKRGLTFEQLLRHGMIHQVLANDRFWTRRRNVLIQRYEELLADPVEGVVALARHLGIALAEGEAAQIADDYSLEANKARTDALRHRLQQVGVDLIEQANSQICDATTLLHWNHVRDGGSGSWIRLSRPRQRRALDRLCGHWLHARNYPLTPAGAERDVLADPRLGWREALRVEADLIVGEVNHRVRTASQRFPSPARWLKRILGIRSPGPVGATVFTEAKPESPVDSSSA